MLAQCRVEELMDKVSDLADTVKCSAHMLRASCAPPAAMANTGLRILIIIFFCARHPSPPPLPAGWAPLCGGVLSDGHMKDDDENSETVAAMAAGGARFARKLCAERSTVSAKSDILSVDSSWPKSSVLSSICWEHGQGRVLFSANSAGRSRNVLIADLGLASAVPIAAVPADSGT